MLCYTIHGGSDVATTGKHFHKQVEQFYFTETSGTWKAWRSKCMVVIRCGSVCTELVVYCTWSSLSFNVQWYAVIVCLSVFHGVLQRWLNLESSKQCHTIVQGLVLWCQKSLQNSNGITPNYRWGRLKWQFSINILLYLRNGARYGHRYYWMLIATCMCSIDCCYFQWLWVTLTMPDDPVFLTFCIAFHIFIESGGRDCKFGR